jgi:hypothetical protein
VFVQDVLIESPYLEIQFSRRAHPNLAVKTQACVSCLQSLWRWTKVPLARVDWNAELVRGDPGTAVEQLKRTRVRGCSLQA